MFNREPKLLAAPVLSCEVNVLLIHFKQADKNTIATFIITGFFSVEGDG